jgi:soluble lytic murein transglycosylase
MLRQSLIFFGLFLALVQPTPASPLYPLPNEQLAVAAEKCKENNYGSAREAATKAPQGGIREFILGIAAYRLQEWEHAADHFSRAAGSFPLLADYALYNSASALYRLDRYAAALPPLQRLARDFPDSPLTRQALFLTADILYDSKDYPVARSAYQKFVEKFPSGPDALTAIYKSALCLERMGDSAGAASALRSIWLKYPAAAIAAKAEIDLLRLAAQGTMVAPYSNDELLSRGMTLYDLRKFGQAAEVFQNVTSGQLPDIKSGKYLLKGGQALFKARRYREAEQAFTALLARKIDREIYEEAYFWLGRTLARNNRDEEAFATYMKLAEFASSPQLADRALLESAYIRKNQNRMGEALSLLKKIAFTSADTTIKQSITWEIAWWSFQSGDMKSAVEYLKPLAENDSSREKSLYWLGRALFLAGDNNGSQAVFALLLAEFPFGFYAQTYRTEMDLKGDDISLPATNLCEILPLSAGYERVKALITFGLYDEARKELAVAKKKLSAKNGAVPGLARLYLEMEDFNGAYNLLRNERPQRFEKEKGYQWGLCFPLAFREYVAGMASEFGIPEGLIYAVIRAESSFSPTALSPAGAVGLMQLMPATAASVANRGKGGFNADTLTSPKTNIRYGVKHLRDLFALYKGDRILAVAAYNAGAGNVNRWRKTFGHLRRDEFVENIPFAETREYVKKVISGAEIYDRLYKLDNPSAPPPAPRQKDVPVTEKPQA